MEFRILGHDGGEVSLTPASAESSPEVCDHSTHVRLTDLSSDRNAPAANTRAPVSVS